jgi:hypothetical protein
VSGEPAAFFMHTHVRVVEPVLPHVLEGHGVEVHDAA